MKKPYIILFISFLSITLFSQDTLRFRKKEWANIGVGVDASKIINGFDLINVGVDYNRILKNTKKLCYQLGANHSSDFWGVPSLNVINPGIGLALMDKYFLFAIFAGPGLMWGKTWNEKTNNTTSFLTVGSSLNIQFAIKPLKDLGIGIVGFTNINSFQSTIGFRVGLQLSSKPE